jgi:predicted nucleotidyltransferase
VKAGRTRSAARERQRVPAGEIRRVALDIAERFSPRKVILFGSYAEGHPRPDSDVDLLVVTETPAGPDASLKIRRATHYSFPIDIVVYDERLLAQRLRAGDFFLQDAMKCGKVLYERPGR